MENFKNDDFTEFYNSRAPKFYINFLYILLIIITLLSFFNIWTEIGLYPTIIFSSIIGIIHYILLENYKRIVLFLPIFLINFSFIFNNAEWFNTLMYIGEVISLVIIAFSLYEDKKKTYVYFFLLSLLFLSKDFFSFQIFVSKVFSFFIIFSYLSTISYLLFGYLNQNRIDEKNNIDDVKPKKLISKIKNPSFAILASTIALSSFSYFTDINQTIENGFKNPDKLAQEIYSERMDNYTGERIGAICYDGWISHSTGRGTCSSHGGVREWRYQKKPEFENAKRKAYKISWMH